MIEKRRATIPTRMTAAVGLSALIFCLMASANLSGRVARYYKHTPFSVKLTLLDTPKMGKPIRVTFNVESDMDQANAEKELLNSGPGCDSRPASHQCCELIN
jgi:hypothetical protein